MTFKKLLLLGALFAALIFYISKVELASDDVKHAAEQPLLKLQPQAVARLEITNAQGSFALINSAPKADVTPAPDNDSLSESETKAWSVEGIKDSELDRGVLNTTLATLRNLKLENPLSAEDTDKDLSVYGLTKPEVKVGLKAGAIDRTFSLGKLNEFVSKRYLQQSTDAAIYMVSDDLYKAANKSSSDFRNHMPIDLAAADVENLTIKSGAGTVSLRQDQGTWKITSPGTFSAGDTAVDTLTRDLRNTKAASFIDGANGSDAQYGLAAPFITISAQTKSDDPSKKNVEIKFGRVETAKDDKKESHYFMFIGGRDPIFALDADPSIHFAKSEKDLRLKQLVKIPIDRIDTVDVAISGRDDIKLARKGSDWTVNGKDGDTPFVEEFLHSLSDLAASDFPAPGASAALGFDAPTARITCALRPEAAGGATETKTVVVGKQLGDEKAGYAAMVEGSNEPFIITAESFKKIAPHYVALVKPEQPAVAPPPKNADKSTP